MKKSWFIVLMLFLAGAISYMDRAALSIAAPLIMKDLHLDPAKLGIVFSAFFVGYSLFSLVGGYASDRFGAKRVLFASMSLWSVFSGLTAGAFSMASLLVVRVVFGAGEGPYLTCTNKMLNGWFEHGKQTTAVGFATAGQQFGGAIAGPIVGVLALHFGWRVSFIVIALMGLVWVSVWAATVTDRPGERDIESRNPKIAARGDVRHAGAATSGEPVAPLGTYLRNPQILATSFAFFGYAYIVYFFLSWFPSYLTMERHLSIASMSVVSVIPWVFGVVGVALGGWVSDVLFRITGNALLSRKLVIVVSLLISAVCIAIAG
ncbi:MFS transporter, partial [Trinickia mobilis]|uniref:MFS transporter n=1 Tax=Trinickia mobilis TaxID=2816356 RepID=UPI002867E963